MNRWLRNGLLVLAGLVGALVIGGYGRFSQGWFVDAQEPKAISALLRPHDEVLRPDGEGPFPAALLFHGCGGIRSFTHDWAARLRDQGFLSVIVDSYAGRDLAWEDVCSGRALLGAERAGDVLVSLDDVRRRPDVDPERIVLMGWSHGSWTVMELMALDPPQNLPWNLSRAPADGLAGVSATVLFYPYCGVAAHSPGDWSSDARTLMLLAEHDSLAAPEDCRAVADALREQGRAVDVHTYDARHGFDAPDYSTGPNDHYDAEATADARARVAAFLAPLVDATP
jgi:dienelactone hydrolase